jgi:hypothetical protein
MAKVNIHSVAEDIEILPNEWAAYFNKETGEVESISEEALVAFEDGLTEEEYMGDGNFEFDMKIAEEIKQENSKFIELPSKFEINEYKIMESFIHTIENNDIRGTLSISIKGSGAFRRFKDNIDRYGITESWYKYKSNAYEDVVRDWANANNLEIA